MSSRSHTFTSAGASRSTGTSSTSHKRTCLPTMLLVAAAASTSFTPLARAEDAAEPKDAPLFSKEWAMSKISDGKDYLSDASGEVGGNVALAVAKGVLKGGGFEEIAKTALAAALNSYIPGLGGMLGLTGSGADPFAAHAEAILNRIDQAEEHILDEMADFWEEVRENRDIDFKADFNTLRYDLQAWQTEYTTWGQLAQPQAYTDLIGDMRRFIQAASLEIMRKGGMNDENPYPYLHHLEMLAQVIQLQSLNAPKHAYMMASWGMGVHNYDTYNMASTETLAKIDEMAKPTVLAALENAIQPAFDLAQTLANDDPFARRVEWMFKPEPEETWACQTPELEDKVRAHGLQPVALGFDGWMPLRYEVRRVGPSESPIEHCIVAALPYGAPVNQQVYLSTYDGMTRVFKTRDEALSAHRKGMYNMLLRVGWAPYRVFLDRWWNVLRAHGLRSGDRPYYSLDRALDDYLADGESAPLKPLLDVLKVNTVTSGELTARKRSKFVGYGLQYGDEGLLQMLFAGPGYDPLTPTGEFPLSLHEQFVTQAKRDPSRMKEFYQGQFAAKAVAVLF